MNLKKIKNKVLSFSITSALISSITAINAYAADNNAGVDISGGINKAINEVKVQFKDGKLEEVKGAEQILDCDLLLIAAGFIGIEDDLKTKFELETTLRNTIVTQPNSYQVKDKYFAAGDCHRGQSLVVWAIHEGKECAKEVDAYLMGYTNME